MRSHVSIRISCLQLGPAFLPYSRPPARQLSLQVARCHLAATPRVGPPSAPDRSAHVPEPLGLIDLSGRLPGGSPMTGVARTRAFNAAARSLGPPGTLRVFVAMRCRPRPEPEFMTYFDFDISLFDSHFVSRVRPGAFTRLLEEAVYARLCEVLGLNIDGPAPLGEFTPRVGSRAFLRTVAARGAICLYRTWWPAAALPSSDSSSSPSSTPPTPPRLPNASSWSA